ncbi:MAG: TetR/AcrR family transcriptional regulator [Sporichthyaceae bacterium]
MERTRALALDAARKVLISEGWEALTQQRVADVAGIGRATVYRHWPDRVTLLREVCAAEVVTLHTPLTGDVRADLRSELASMHAELVDGGFDKVLVALTERCFREDELREVKRAIVEDGTANMRRILDAGIAAGDLPPLLDVDAAVARLVGPMLYHHLFADAVVSPRDLNETVDGFLREWSPT